MKTSFEHTVLAYLDGLLDRRAEREFLREVSRDPEKQAVLEQYRRLNSSLQNRSEPVAVPLKTQQALAERIPALQEVIPRVAPTAAVGGGSGAAALFSRKIVTLLVGGGIAIGTLTTVLLVDPFSAGSDASDIPERHSAIQTEAAPLADAGSDLRRGTSDNTATRDVMESSPSSSTEAGASQSNAARSAVADNSAAPSMQNKVDISRGGTSREALLHQEAVTPSSSVSAAGQDHAFSTDATPEPRGNASSSVYKSEWALPLRGIDVTSSEMPGERPLPDRHPVPALRSILDGRLYAYIESGAAQQQMRGSSSLSKDVFRGVYLAGLRYDFSSRFAGGIEVGQSTFAREGLVTTRETLSQANGSEIIIIDRSLQDNLQPWLRLHGLYTFNPGDRLRFQADAGSGLLLGSNRALIYSLGLSTVYPLTYGLHARAGIHYSGTWLSGSDAQPDITPSTNGVIGIIRRANNTGTVYASSFELRIGFGILLW